MDSASLATLVGVLGALVAGFFLPVRNPQWQKKIARSIDLLVYLILALIGLSLAAVDALASELKNIAGYTALLFACIMGANLAVLAALDRLAPWGGRKAHNQSTHNASQFNLANSLRQAACVGGGILLGLVLPKHWQPPPLLNTIALLTLILLIGIQLRSSGVKLRQILLHRRGLFVCLLTILGAALGASLFALLSGQSWSKSMALASGFGWYSLSGIVITDAFGPIWGSIALLNDLAREFFALLFIPLLMPRYPCAAISSGGVTALDFTLPIIQHSGGAQAALLAISFSFPLNLLSPLLMVFFAQFKI